MRSKAKTPEGRLRVKAIVEAVRHGHDATWVREIAHEKFGVPTTEDRCLTCLDKPQLIELVDEVVLRTGGTPGQHVRGPRGERRVRQDPTGVVTYLASREQRDLILALAREVFGGAETHTFRAFLAKMTFKSDVRLLASNEARKVIDALTAMAGRGWKPRAEEQQA